MSKKRIAREPRPTKAQMLALRYRDELKDLSTENIEELDRLLEAHVMTAEGRISRLRGDLNAAVKQLADLHIRQEVITVLLDHRR